MRTNVDKEDGMMKGREKERKKERGGKKIVNE